MQALSLSSRCEPARSFGAARAQTCVIVRPATHWQPVRRSLAACQAADDDAAAPQAVTKQPDAAAAPATNTAAAPGTTDDFPQEKVFFEGTGSNIELALSLLLSTTVIYLPLTLASIGRRLWVDIKATDKRIIVTNTSPAFKGQTQVAFSQIKEIRTVPRAFGAWGDMVIFLKDGSRLELVGIEKFAEIKQHIESCIRK